MSDHSLPSEFPLECLTKMFEIIRSDEGITSANIGEFVRHAYHVAGYGLYLWLGNEPPLIGGPSANKFIGAVLAEVAATPQEKIEAIPWPAIFQIVQLVLSLISKK